MQVHRLQPSQLIWIDALCIDQSNAREKGYQVGRMGRIYSQAEQVYASVGHQVEGDASELVISAARQIDPYDDLTDRAVQRDVLHAIQNHNIFSDYGHRVPWWHGSMWRDFLQQLALPLAAFTRRPYFERVWVVQELHLPVLAPVSSHGHRPFPTVLMCGFHFVKLDQLRFLCACIEAASRGNSHCSEELTNLRNDWVNSPLHEMWNDVDIVYDMPLELASILNDFHRFKCTNPLDRIFGFRALMRPDIASRLKPDYAISPVQLAKNVLGCLHFDMYGRHPVDVNSVNCIAEALELASCAIEQPEFKNSSEYQRANLWSPSTDSCMEIAFSSRAAKPTEKSRVSLCVERKGYRRSLDWTVLRRDFCGNITGDFCPLRPSLCTNKSMQGTKAMAWDDFVEATGMPEAGPLTSDLPGLHFLWSDSKIVAVTSCCIRPGDVLLEYLQLNDIDMTAGLILRRNKGLLYRVLGTAFLSRQYAINESHYHHLLSEPGFWKREPYESQAPTATVAFELLADIDDLFAFHQSIQKCKDLRSFRAELLQSAFTHSEWSSFAISRPSFEGREWPGYEYRGLDDKWLRRYSANMPPSYLKSEGAELVIDVLRYSTGAELRVSQDQPRRRMSI
jgi:hypothetical protein